MRSVNFKPALLKSALAASVLLLASGAAFGQTVTATPSGTVDVGASVTTAALILTAGASPIDAGSVTVTGAAAPFSVDTTGCAGGVAAAGGSCTINVTFSPTATGPFTDPVTVSATSGTIAVVVAGSPVTLSGTGTVPTVTAANPLVFIDPLLGVRSAPQTVTLNNVADTQLTFTTVISSTAYSVAAGGTCPSPIVLGGATQSCTINLVYTPPTGLVVNPSATLTVMSAFGTATPTQVAQISLVDTNPAALTAGTTVEVDLTAVATSVTLNDGSTVPMWGYQCGANSLACTPLNPALSRGPSAIWSPVVITALAGQNLAIDLTNSLSFTAGAGTNTVPTSLVIVGQLGGGLGTTASAVPSPAHATQSTTWPIAGGPTGPQNTPPPQGTRVQSFATEVAAGTTTRLVWNNLKAGTYLIESGTHPSIQGPMGLYGILVVTTAPTATAPGIAYGTGTTAVNYSAEIPLLLSEIDPVQNTAVQTAVSTAGFSETAVWSGQPGGCGNPGSATYNTCYPPAVNYTPLYYLFNGVAFDKTHASASLFPALTGAAATPVTGTVLVRLVNAGLRMHVPSIVGAQTGTATAPALPPAGFSLIAEDGNVLPGVPRVQSEVFMAAGKTTDVMINVPAAGGTALPIFDRELSLSGNAIARDAGMIAYLGINGGTLPSGVGSGVTAVARPDTYNSVITGQTLVVSDPGKGVIANDTNVYGVRLIGTVAGLTLNSNGTFTYTGAPTTFTYCANGTVTGTTCSSSLTAVVSLNAATIENASAITCTAPSFTSTTATYLAVKPPGVLGGCTDPAGYPLTVSGATATTPVSVAVGGGTVLVDANGGFTAANFAAGTYTFSVAPKNSQGTVASAVNVTLVFPAAAGLAVRVLDGADKTTTIGDYRWIIEEDQTFYVDPRCTTNPLPAGCPTINAQHTPFTFGTNFHTSHMPLVADGCTGPASCEGGQTIINPTTGLHVYAVCDVGNGVCRPDVDQIAGTGFAQTLPSTVALDPSKRYYISVLPGDAANPFNNGYAGVPDCSPAGVAAGSCGHGMGGAPIPAAVTCTGTGTTRTCASVANRTATCTPAAPATSCLPTGVTIAPVTVLTQPSPYPTATLTVFVFEDDFPLNGEHDSGGGVDVIAANEPGLGNFQVTIFDDAGGTGDATGQPTYDMFNMPLSNSLAGTIDPVTNLDACPISQVVTDNVRTGNGTQKGIVGMIVTCPKYESDGKTLSALAGQVVVKNLWQGRYGVVATPGADRIARGEEWLQTNTLDGQKAHDSFMRIGEPAYFQEFGPAGYHVNIGFANPQIINDRRTNSAHSGMCDPIASGGGGLPCNKEVKGHVTTARMTRVPDERLYGSGTRDSFAFTQCYAALGDPDGADFAFTKCDPDGNFDFRGIPAGNFKITIFDQWNDQIVDGIAQPVGVTGTATTVDMGEIAAHQWQTNIYTRTFFDSDGTGVSTNAKTGLALVSTNIRFRDGSFSNFNNTDLTGAAGFNEVFPLFNWYVIETTSTRFKTTGVHVVYDAGGPVDGSSACSAASPCGGSVIGQNMTNTYEANPLPADLSVPGAVYCAGADCTGASIAAGPVPSSATNHSTGRIDPPFWFGSYGWQSFPGQNAFLEWGKAPYVAGETGGISGHVVYASTRPFDDPQLLLQLSWEPLIPHVRVNLYKEGFAADGVTPTLTLIDHTDTSSFDDWTQGFRSDGKPNMNCPGQSTSDLFFYALQNQPQYLDFYQNGSAATALPYASQYKCYDGMHNWVQLQPAPYDGMYSFPSVTGIVPTTGKPSGTNCTACVPNPDATDPYRSGQPMLPAGNYVVEVVVPPGYELVKEEDKNILIGDNFIAPATQQFGGLGSIFILPDQAAIAATYNPNNPQNPTQALGRVSSLPSHEGDTGSVESFWPCVGAVRTVPDYISLFPGSAEVAPFAGASRPLCDRKEVALNDQSSALVKFYLYTSTHVASHFTGVITDDFTAEFDPFSPQFGEKFAPAYLPVSIKDWAGNEVSRVYSDQFGAYNGLNYSTWEVNPPNPTGYGPTMMVTCMNDRGPGVDPDPFFQAGYSQFCYELAFMPGQTGYFDTPVTPTSAFSEGFNHPDCSYPDATPAIASVTSADTAGPWVSVAGHTLTITALGDAAANQQVDNYGYSGPSVVAPPFNQQKVRRHFGFGGTAGSVTIGGVTAVVGSWSDTLITVTVPSGVPVCPVQQQWQYGGPASAALAAQCGQLVITTANTAPAGQPSNAKQSVDTVTVTIGGKKPIPLAAGQTIQSAIDAASPGDLILIPGGIHREILVMWKPVRLQGVGAATSIIDADAHPAGKLDPWRQQINCVFGLTPDGRPRAVTDTGCSSGWTGATNSSPFQTMIIDRLPFEAVVGWDATLNGNLAEQLIEPSLMGAYEGAAITVLGKGVVFPAGTTLNDAFGASAGVVGAAFPAGTRLLDGSTSSMVGCGPNGSSVTNPYPSNFYCNPSSIDGLGIRNSSQGGGGIFVHAYGHNLQIANNRVYNNSGTLGGGITIGQGEHPDVNLAGAAPTTFPGSCENAFIPNSALPFCFDMRVNVHHNAVTQNSAMGDELFSATGAGAGGVNFNTGADYYSLTNNWVCGNLNSGDGGGVAHIGFIKNGHIEHNSILFNQSTNPTITTNGAGLLVMGAPDIDPTCGATTDADCVPAPSTVSPSDGTGPGLVINANLILGNAAEAGSGGGLRLQHINGNDALNLPLGQLWCFDLDILCVWNSVRVTNNIIADNVAGWDGGGVSLLDALAVRIVNNTIISNDSTASSGALFGALFAPLASAPGSNCYTGAGGTGSGSCPQAAGLVSDINSAVLRANLPASGFSCPFPLLIPPGSANCRYFSNPALYNNVIWQNRAFRIGVGSFGTGLRSQQKVVTLYPMGSATPVASQPQAVATTANGTGVIITGGTGACVPGVSYWDVGVRGDTGPSNHVSVSGATLRINPNNSVVTNTSLYTTTSNTSSDPTVLSQYCNGSRVPPEAGLDAVWQVPPGTIETNGLPHPVFSLSPAATVDEGNNWINMRWGPLALTNPSVLGTDLNYGGGAPLGNYGLASSSSAIDYIRSTAFIPYAVAPATDFYGAARKTNNAVDAGAVEFQGTAVARTARVSPTPLAFGNWATSTPAAERISQTVTVTNTGSVTLTGGTFTFGGTNANQFARATVATPGGAGTCVTPVTLAAGLSCTYNVAFVPTSVGAKSATLIVAFGGGATVSGLPIALSGTGVTMAVNPASLAFGTVASGTTSAAQTLTVRNSTGGTRSLTIAITAPFSRAAGGCGATLANGTSCTISVVFGSATPPGAKTGTATITTNGGFTVANSPVMLSGTTQ